MSLVAKDPLSEFYYALHAPETKRQYPRRLKVFFDFLKLEGPLESQAAEFLAKVVANRSWAQSKLMEFIVYQKGRVARGEIAASTIKNYFKPAKLFITMTIDEPIVNWDKVAKGLPSSRQAANDRAPTLEELRMLCDYPDRRIKPIIYTMASSGIRMGAWDTLRWKHITPIHDENGAVRAAKLLVYPGDEEQYYTFITPEAFHALKDWMDFRARYGESVTGDSWVMRNMWKTTDINYAANLGRAGKPKQLKHSGIKSLIERALKSQGLWKPLAEGAKRREWKAGHGYRKFFKTQAEQVMRPVNVEIAMGHDIGLSGSYYKPTENEVLEDYVKAVKLLTIGRDSQLSLQIVGLQGAVENQERNERQVLDVIADIRREIDELKRPNGNNFLKKESQSNK